MLLTIAAMWADDFPRVAPWQWTHHRAGERERTGWKLERNIDRILRSGAAISSTAAEARAVDEYLFFWASVHPCRARINATPCRAARPTVFTTEQRSDGEIVVLATAFRGQPAARRSRACRWDTCAACWFVLARVRRDAGGPARRSLPSTLTWCWYHHRTRTSSPFLRTPIRLGSIRRTPRAWLAARPARGWTDGCASTCHAAARARRAASRSRRSRVDRSRKACSLFLRAGAVHHRHVEPVFAEQDFIGHMPGGTVSHLRRLHDRIRGGVRT